METPLSRDATRRTQQTQQEGGKNPMHQRAFAVGQQRLGEIVEGALTAVAPGAFASRPVVVRTPGPNVVALAPGTLERALLPPERMDIGVAGVSAEELV